jgi:hypothetical protein
MGNRGTRGHLKVKGTLDGRLIVNKKMHAINGMLATRRIHQDNPHESKFNTRIPNSTQKQK